MLYGRGGAVRPQQQVAASVATPVWSRDLHRRPTIPQVSPATAPRILLLGGDSDWNLGDHAIQYGLCHAMVRAAPNVRVTVSSDLPAREVDARRLPGVIGSAPRRASGLPRLLAAAARQDLVLIGGGGLFQDDDSRVKMPYWALRLAALRAVNGNVRAMSLGVGPLQRAGSRSWARRAAAGVDGLSVRDPYAGGWMQQSLGRPVPVVPDPAFLVPPEPADNADRLLADHGLDPARPLIGVALRHWFHARGGWLPRRWRVGIGLDRQQPSPAMAHCLDQIAAALGALAREQGAGIVLLPSYPLPHEGDVAACLELARRLPEVNPALLLIRNPCLYKAVCGRLSLMVAARMHPLILAAGMGTPVVGLSYNGKFGGLFDMLGTTPRLLPLDRFRHGGGDGALLSLARDAMTQDHALLEASRVLAGRTQRAVVDLLADAIPGLGTVSP